MTYYPRFAITLTIALSLFACSTAAEPSDAAPAVIKIDGDVDVVPPGVGIRKMLGMVRHPDGSIFLNTQHQELLFKSIDDGQTWTPVPVIFPDLAYKQVFQGLGVTGDGRLWLLHQSSAGPGRDGKDLFVSYSADGGWVWKTTPIDFGRFAPHPSQRLFLHCYNDYNTFVERFDGTLMIGVGLSYSKDYSEDPKHYNGGLLRPNVELGGEMIIRTNDGGKTWKDPTLVNRFVAEVGYAGDPTDSERILAMARVQRRLLAGEDRAVVTERTDCPPGEDWVYKQGFLLESTNGGRSFQEVPGSLTEYYEHRGTIVWTERNVVVITHQGGVPGKGAPDGQLYARISLDGGRKWLNDTATGTPHMNRSKKFLLVPDPPGHSFTAPTVERESDHFLTVYAYYHEDSKTTGVKGIFWHLVHRSNR